MILSELTGGVRRITLNRPDVHNAFDEALIAAIHEAMQHASADPATRVVVLAGAGRSFCAGADLGWMQRAASWTEAENRADAARLAAMLRAIAECPKPVIARVHGAAFGGGVGLAAAADICLTGPRALFSLSEVKLGLIPATIAPHVVAAMGARQARRWFLTAERFDGVTAHQMGFSHGHFADDAALDAEIDRLAAALLANGPQAMAESKALIRACSRPLDQALVDETAAWIARIRTTAEAREGLQAFFDKRPPAWGVRHV